jgi:hypothetical protein
MLIHEIELLDLFFIVSKVFGNISIEISSIFITAILDNRIDLIFNEFRESWLMSLLGLGVG